MGNSELVLSQVATPAPASCTIAALITASVSCLAAAAACRAWEAGGDASIVTATAVAALTAANIALEAVFTDEPWDRTLEEPSTRQARLAYAAWFALLVGTDEHGTAGDLDCAAELFRAAGA
jgi:hypothetical protein